LVRPAVRSDEDWPSLPEVDAQVPALAEQVDALRLVVEEAGPTVPVLQTVFSPLTVAGYLVGEERMKAVSDLRRLEEVMVPALDRIAQTLGDFVRRSIEAGAAGIFYAISGYASADVLALEEYQRLALPSDVTVLRSIAPRGWFNVLHLCGPRIHFELARELPADAVSWSIHEPGNPTLAQGRDASGRAAMGGLDQSRTLTEGSVAAVEREARAAIGDTNGEGLLLAPGCSVPPTAPDANLAAMMEAATM
jgi:uroporphyrinogen decarboxylase